MDIHTKIEDCKIVLINMKTGSKEILESMMNIIEDIHKVVDDIREKMEI